MEEENVNDAGMPKQKNLLRTHTTPQQVCLPNGQSFLARYESEQEKLTKEHDDNNENTNWT